MNWNTGDEMLHAMQPFTAICLVQEQVLDIIRNTFKKIFMFIKAHAFFEKQGGYCNTSICPFIRSPVCLSVRAHE